MHGRNAPRVTPSSRPNGQARWYRSDHHGRVKEDAAGCVSTSAKPTDGFAGSAKWLPDAGYKPSLFSAPFLVPAAPHTP